MYAACSEDCNFPSESSMCMVGFHTSSLRPADWCTTACGVQLASSSTWAGSEFPGVQCEEVVSDESTFSKGLVLRAAPSRGPLSHPTFIMISNSHLIIAATQPTTSSPPVDPITNSPPAPNTHKSPHLFIPQSAQPSELVKWTDNHLFPSAQSVESLGSVHKETCKAIWWISFAVLNSWTLLDLDLIFSSRIMIPSAKIESCKPKSKQKMD